jgi:iron complex outermembrane receptor protein
MKHRNRSSLAATVLLLALAATAGPVRAAASVSGTVHDRSGNPVAGAIVEFLLETGPVASVVTDENGRYQSPPLPAEAFRVTAAFPRATVSTSRSVALVEGEPALLDLRLDLDVGVERVVVTAASPRDALESKEIRESFAKDVGEALARIDGVQAVRKGGIANDVVVRGFKGENLSVLVDGHRLYGACPNRMDPPAFHVDFAEIERVEIRKGPYDLEHGGSLGGTVNIVTRKPESGLHGSVQVSAGSFGSLAGSFAGSYAAPRGSLKGGYSARRGDPYEDGSGKPFTASANYAAAVAGVRAFDVRTGWLGGTVDLGPSRRLEIQATRQEGDRQLYPYLQMDADYDDADRLSATYREQRAGGAVERIEAGISWAGVDHLMTDTLRTSSAGSPREYSMATLAESGVWNARVDVAFSGGLVVGLEGWNRAWDAATTLRSAAFVPQRSIPDADLEAAGVFARWEGNAGARFRLSASGRVDRARSSSGAGSYETDLYQAYHGTRETSRTDTVWSASASGIWAATESLEVVFGAGRTNRMPDPQERYFALRRSGTDWVGNPSLAPVENLGTDVGLRFQRGSLQFEATAFYSLLDDAVQVTERARLEEVPGVSNAVARTYVNHDARIWGGEVSLRALVRTRWFFFGGLSSVRGTQDPDPALGITDPDLPEMAPLTVRAGIRFDTGSWFVEGEGAGAAKQDRINSDLEERETGAWEIVNLRAGVQVGRVSILVAADNVFDREYARSLSYARDPFRSGAIVPEPGRTFALALQGRYGSRR